MKPRNHIVLAMIKSNKSSQIHGKTTKAQRRNTKVKLMQDQQRIHNDRFFAY
jgi:hypothetical protein